MSAEQLDAIVARYRTDPAFAAQMNRAGSADDAAAIAREHGFEVSADEFLGAAQSVDLTEAELEAVAAGDASTYDSCPCQRTCSR